MDEEAGRQKGCVFVVDDVETRPAVRVRREKEVLVVEVGVSIHEVFLQLSPNST
jgi:hypothetical protein